MANRAYLYASDSSDVVANSPIREDYFDSRWTIPIAWWFFFDRSNLQLMDVTYGGDRWQELKLISPKATTLSRFARRRSILDNVVDGRLEGRYFKYFFLSSPRGQATS